MQRATSVWVAGVALATAAALPNAHAQVAAAPGAATPGAAIGKVVVAGVVPDEPTRAAVLAKVREVYGADRVVDQLGVGPLVAPPNWSQQVQKLINPELRKVSKGELRINGNVIDVAGNVDNEATRQQLVSTMVTQLANPTYTVRNGLRVGVPDQQVLDAALANRTIAFQPGNAQLTPAGMQVLDELLPVLRNFKERRFEIVGHTDGQGQRQRNVILSEERANAVKAYLVSKGIAATQFVTLGAGPDMPVADNQTADGRARNRRIVFRVLA